MIQNYSPLMGLDSSIKPELWLVVGKGCVFHPEPNEFLWKDDSKFSASEATVIGLFEWRAVAVVYKTIIDDADQTPLRAVLAIQNESLTSLLSHGLQILTALRDHRFCGRCGNQCIGKAGEWAMVCRQCRAHYYPRISPCIIVLIHRNDEMLLVLHNRHAESNPIYTTVAGFIEPGESAEQAVIREVMEETGILVHEPNYRGSQNWPFPHSLMLGFHAEYKSGELQLAANELCDGAWFKTDNLPQLPPGFSISRKLIELFIQS